MKFTAIFFFWSSLLLHFQAVAQQNTPPSLQPLFSPDNGLKAEERQLKQQIATDESLKEVEIFTQHYLQSKQQGANALPDTSCVVTIPLVFQVFHPQGSTGVPLSQIDYALKDLNKNFAGADNDYQNVNAAFSGVKSYTKVRFARALIDPQGNPTTGVVYYQDKQSGFGNGSGWNSEIPTCAWDNYKYFNVYVMKDLYADEVTNNSGVCWYPSTTMSNNNLARMVYNYVYLGQGGSSYNDLEFNQTFTHECGHSLNLRHTFEGYNCAGTGDLCNDTPPTDAAGGGCTATICGNLINGENYLDYNSSCYKNFTMDQNSRMEAALLVGSRFPLWQYDNLVATGLLSPTSTNACVAANPFFAYTKTSLVEEVANDGSLEMPPVQIYACAGAQFVKMGQTLTIGTDYNITNVPSGLSVEIVTAANGKSASLTFSGQALSHDVSNSVSNLAFSFTNAAVVGGNASAILNASKAFSIDFKKPWEKTCVTLNLSTNANSTWNRFETAGPIPRYYGLWYDSGIYSLENYGRGIITTSANSDNIQFLPLGTSIGSGSTWRAGGSQGVLYSATYPSLNNQTGYVGFRMQAGNDFYYGWMQISVSATNGVTLLEYHYNEKPNEPIDAGSACIINVAVAGEMQAEQVRLFPNPAHDYVRIEGLEEGFVGGKISLSDIHGQRLFASTLDSRYPEIPVQGLAAGVYVVSIENKNRLIHVRLVIL